MNPIRSLGRTMLASMFVVEGADTLANASSKVSAYQEVREPLTETVPAFGKLPRLSSAVLAASLVPSTLAEHRFWDESDDTRRAEAKRGLEKTVRR